MTERVSVRDWKAWPLFTFPVEVIAHTEVDVSSVPEYVTEPFWLV